MKYSFPNAGINETEGRRGYEMAIGTASRVCDSTPSFIEDMAGTIIGQTFERRGEPDKVRVAETWHRARLWAAAPDMLAALKALLEYEDDRPAPGTRGAEVYAQAEAAIAKAEGAA